jgi:hypothetical protein
VAGAGAAGAGGAGGGGGGVAGALGAAGRDGSEFEPDSSGVGGKLSLMTTFLVWRARREWPNHDIQATTRP